MSAGCHPDVLSKTLKGPPQLHIFPYDVLKDYSFSSNLVKTFLNFKPLSHYYVSLSIQHCCCPEGPWQVRLSLQALCCWVTISGRSRP